MTSRHVVLTSVLALGLGAALSAQKPATPPNPFASARTLACSFSTFAVAGWRDGKPNTVTSTEDFSFQIAIVNLKRGRARIIGANGAVEATLVLTPTGLNVIEQTPIGNFMLTTVFTAGAQNGRFLAAHARHVGDLTAVPSPSQHYGSCSLAK
jgi:hypothetical protein